MKTIKLLLVITLLASGIELACPGNANASPTKTLQRIVVRTGPVIRRRPVIVHRRVIVRRPYRWHRRYYRRYRRD